MENYKKKYNKAIEKAKAVKETYPNLGNISAIAVLESIFPELCESEDERIRKALIHGLSELRIMFPTYPTFADVKMEDILAWLEKQKEIKTEDFGEFINELSKQFPEVSFAKLSRVAVRVKNWLEKQRQEKSIDMSIKEKAHQIAWEYSKHYDPLLSKESWCEMAALDMAYWLEKQSKQESTDKVMPKFKVGDWITNGACIIQITSVDDRYYWHDNDCVGGDIESIDKEYHLWTIQDAKKGDILQANKCTLIFNCLTKDIDGNSVISSWYCCDTKTFYGIGASDPDLWVIEGVVPATKEQRDFLFQKMKEAGYEWDTEKKELKKIEQKSSWSEEDEHCIELLLPIIDSSSLSDEYSSMIGDIISLIQEAPGCLESDKKKMINWIKSNNWMPIKQDTEIRDLWVYIREWNEKFGRLPKDEDELAACIDYVMKRQKPSWNKEDQKELKVIISELKKYVMFKQYGTPLSAYDISWLEELPSRFIIQQQPKQEWSEEDESWFKELELMALSFSNDDSYRKKFFDWLKSLKPQPHWKPSEEQMDNLRAVISFLTPNSILGRAMESLYNDINKL